MHFKQTTAPKLPSDSYYGHNFVANKLLESVVLFTDYSLVLASYSYS